jgi:predicted ATP-dependent protease
MKQSIAITGSMNQMGQVQAIGGVNEKIEGFYDICRLTELTGEQGVIIPATNVQHLMVRDDVIQAVEDGKFHIYGISHVNQALALLSGIDAGEYDEESGFPENTFNAQVMAQIQKWGDHNRNDKDSSAE